MRCYFRLGGQLELDVVGGRKRGLGLSHFDAVLLQTGWLVGVGRGWRTDTGFRDCLISDAVLLQNGWTVGVWRGWRTDTGVGTDTFRMRCYFRLASWSWTRLEDGHGGWDCLISDAVILQIGWPVGV